MLYVDDPSIVVGGTPDESAREFDVKLLFWLALGFTLAWAKGSHTVAMCNGVQADTGVHGWVGIGYALRGKLAVMSLPAPLCGVVRSRRFGRSNEGKVLSPSSWRGARSGTRPVFPRWYLRDAFRWCSVGSLSGSFRAAAGENH